MSPSRFKPEISASGLQDGSQAVLSNTAGLSRPGPGEENDVYPTIASLNARWQVIECKNSIQWILQRQDGRGANHWRGYWFCRTREALLRCARERAGEISGDALVILLRLPERFPETGKTSLARAAASVWGPRAYTRSWRATANGLEGAAVLNSLPAANGKLP